uniref:Uncharacterized protein n=1 Tax=Aegilops tauschii subsp. strangulata TaxID=200361 RepID=A0A453FNI5_AEGTS
MASLTTTTASSPAALPAAASAAPATASSVSPTAAASKRPHLAGDDAPWRVAAAGSAGIRPVPRIHHAPVLRVAQDDSSAYALAIMRNPDPIGMGLAMEAVAEAAGPECIVPGQQAPLRLMGLKLLDGVIVVCELKRAMFPFYSPSWSNRFAQFFIMI